MELSQMSELMGLSVLLGLLALMATAAVARGWLRAGEERSGRPACQKANGFPPDKSSGSKKQKQYQRIRKEKPQQHNFTHRLLAAALKSHSGNISCMDFSSNGKYLATCADDRTIRIWSTKDFLQREHRSMRANVELDHATLVRFSPDCRAFIVWLANGDTLRVFKMTKREDGGYTFTATPEDFPKKHKAPVIDIGIANTGKFIMTASSDTTVLIWSLKGQVLSTINTNQMNNTHAAVSPCGRCEGLGSLLWKEGGVPGGGASLRTKGPLRGCALVCFLQRLTEDGFCLQGWYMETVGHRCGIQEEAGPLLAEDRPL
uniref:Transducin-like 2 isoform 3 n=1 Tax=Homo sapiens TaxID=9606 RepID=A0A0S2Z5C1_HUMAN|nr:transducin -like 2 isoform 3 [Homo sapiens]